MSNKFFRRAKKLNKNDFLLNTNDLYVNTNNAALNRRLSYEQHYPSYPIGAHSQLDNSLLSPPKDRPSSVYRPINSLSSYIWYILIAQSNRRDHSHS